MGIAPQDAVPTLLATCGLAVVGDPPETTLDVLGRAVHVVVGGDADRLQLEARLMAPAAAPAAARLRAHALAADGDTRIAVEAGELVARRTLVRPEAATVFDAVHELGKAVVALAGPDAVAHVPDEPAPDEPAPDEPAPDEPAPDEPALARPGAAPGPAPASMPGDEGYWCFVDEPSPVLAAPDADEVVAMLMPRVWYRVVRDEGEWARVQHPSGAQGVVARRAVTPS